MFRTICTSSALIFGLSSTVHAEEFMLKGADGAVIDSIIHVGQFNGVAAFTSTNNLINLWMEDYDPNYSQFLGVFAVADQPPCADGPRTDPRGFSYPSWGLAQIDFAPGHTEFELQVARCGLESDIITLYGQRVAG